ncbi:MAG: ATP-binding protein [Planctomycetota bacterium]
MTPAPPATPAAQKPTDGEAFRAAPRADELAEIISAYNAVTEKLQHSHHALQNQVLRLREELTSANAQLQRSKRLAALGEMAAGIAHEIRNPLAAIQLYTTLALEDLTPPTAPPTTSQAHGCEAAVRSNPTTPTHPAAHHLHKIADAIAGMGTIVNDVLAFAKELKPEPRVIPAGQAFARVLDAHRPAIRDAKLRVHTTGDGHALYADPDLLHQALLNLVRNAVDAMTPHPHAEGHPHTLTLAAHPHPDAPNPTTLTINDTGPGLAPDTIDRLFNPFFTTRASGTGLGLAIVHRILDAHAGSVTVHNHPTHHGAVFTLHLPAHQNHKPTAAQLPCGNPQDTHA